MPSNETLESRLEWMETRAELADLVTRYGKVIDERDVLGLAALFTADGRLYSRDRMLDAAGTAGIIRVYKDVFNRLGPSFHWHHGHLLERDPGDPDRVTGVLMAHSETFRNGEQYLAALRYTDVYHREEGTWKFEDRELSFLYFASMADYQGILGKDKRVLVYGDERRANWPEGLATWTSYKTVAA